MLLGDKYGWKPIPPEIPAYEFEEILKVVERQKDDLKMISLPAGGLYPTDLLKKWYKLDKNAVDPVYILQSRIKKGKYEIYKKFKKNLFINTYMRNIQNNNIGKN